MEGSQKVRLATVYVLEGRRPIGVRCGHHVGSTPPQCATGEAWILDLSSVLVTLHGHKSTMPKEQT